jgi:hypothetical protein
LTEAVFGTLQILRVSTLYYSGKAILSRMQLWLELAPDLALNLHDAIFRVLLLATGRSV